MTDHELPLSAALDYLKDLHKLPPYTFSSPEGRRYVISLIQDIINELGKARAILAKEEGTE